MAGKYKSPTTKDRILEILVEKFESIKTEYDRISASDMTYAEMSKAKEKNLIEYDIMIDILSKVQIYDKE